MANILGIGIATLDIINVVETYPPEDAEVRTLEQHMTRGGNATNTLTVLSQLGHHCTWGGVLADEPDARHIIAELERYNIDYQHCPCIPNGKVPTSYIALSRASGSRTIIHHRDLPEFSFADFQRIDLTPFDWLHFEGRNVAETKQMINWAKQQRPELSCSLEVEKIRPDIESLFPLVGHLFFSKAFANAKGFHDGPTFLHAIRKLAPTTTLFCGWGEHGAYALNDNNTIHHSSAFPPTKVVDTIGAGDVLNAGIIDSLITHHDLPTVLNKACRLAGIKCGHRGLHVIDNSQDAS